MRHQLGQKSLVVIMAAAMVVLLGAGTFVYRAKARALTDLRAELEQKKTELVGARARIAKRAQLEKEYADLQAELAVLEPSLPTYAYVPTFLKQIEALATDTRNEIAGVRPLPKPKLPEPAPPTGKDQSASAQGEPGAGSAQSAEQAYDRLPIEVSLTGGYWEAAEFLGQLATFPKMIAVNDLQFVPTAASQAAQTQAQALVDLQVKVNLLALIYKGGEERSWTQSDAKNSPS